jgi:hypothetical protein
MSEQTNECVREEERRERITRVQKKIKQNSTTQQLQQSNNLDM